MPPHLNTDGGADVRESRRALLVGIDQYNSSEIPDLTGCVADATAMRDLLEKNADGSPNYSCRLLVSSGEVRITRKYLRAQWEKLFVGFDGDVLFYFSGHGAPLRTGGFFVTQDGEAEDPGLAMDELVSYANLSPSSSVLLILDCCTGGYLCNPPANTMGSQIQLREEVTILAATRPGEEALEVDGHGIFTRLVLGALSGGAADLRGVVSAASIYAYVDQALGPWEQRPTLNCKVSSFPCIRKSDPAAPDSLLRELPQLFAEPESKLVISSASSRSLKENIPSARPKDLRILRDARLIAGDDGTLRSRSSNSRQVSLTPLGQFYWRLARDNRI